MGGREDTGKKKASHQPDTEETGKEYKVKIRKPRGRK